MKHPETVIKYGDLGSGANNYWLLVVLPGGFAGCPQLSSSLAWGQTKAQGCAIDSQRLQR